MKLNETKMLGQFWKKDKDLIAVEIPSEIKKAYYTNNFTEGGINI